MKNLKAWLSSKKAKAFLTELIVLIGVQLMGLEPEQAQQLSEYTLALTVGYMGSQGIADHGKGKAEPKGFDTQD